MNFSLFINVHQRRTEILLHTWLHPLKNVSETHYLCGNCIALLEQCSGLCPSDTFPWRDLLDVHNSDLMMSLFQTAPIFTHCSFLWAVIHHELRLFVWYWYCLWNRRDQIPTAWNATNSSSMTQSLWLSSFKLVQTVSTFFFADNFHESCKTA